MKNSMRKIIPENMLDVIISNDEAIK